MKAYAYLDEHNNVIETDDVNKWAECRRSGRFIVKQEQIRNRRISTVFLGLDHSFGGPPAWFETMVFPLDSHADMDCVRYATYAEAVAGHGRMVDRWRDADPEDAYGLDREA